MHVIYLLIVFILCFFGALSNVGSFVFMKLFFQHTPVYTLLELDVLISICMFLIILCNLIKFRNEEDKKLINRPELVVALCIGGTVGSFLGTLTYFYIYNIYGESVLMSIQNIIIFTLALNSLLYNIFRSFAQTFDIRTYLPCLVVGALAGFLCSLSSVSLLFLIVLIPLIMFNTSQKGAINISMFLIFFILTIKIIVSYLISPIPLNTIPDLIPTIVLSILANYLGTHFREQLNIRIKFFLCNLFLLFVLIFCMFSFH